MFESPKFIRYQTSVSSEEPAADGLSRQIPMIRMEAAIANENEGLAHGDTWAICILLLRYLKR